MIRARWCLLLPLSLAACDRSTTTSPTDATQSTGDPQPLASGDSVAIVAVPQRAPSIDVSGWRFDPSGRWIAEEFTDDYPACGIWDIESGTFLREYIPADDAKDSVDPCVAWDADPRSHSDVSADGKLRASVVGKLTIEQIGGTTRTVDGCMSCGDAMVWAPSGHQLATCNGRMLEIWDADTGKRVRSETLNLPNVEDVLLGWTEEGLGLVLMHEVSAPCHELEPDGSFCDWRVEYDEDGEPVEDPGPMEGYALSSFWWPADGGPPVSNLRAYTSVEMPIVYADAGVRWFAFDKEISYDRDGSSTSLYVFGVGPRTSGLGFTEFDDDGDWLERWDGYWRVDATTHWIEGVTITSGGDDWYAHMQVGWNAIVAEPNPAAFHGQEGEIEGGSPAADIETFAAFGGAAVIHWKACTEDGEDPCQSAALPIGDCELLDVSPMLSVLLVDCEGALKMIEATGRGATVATLPQDPDSSWQWGRSNWLALLERDGSLSVLDAGTGKTLYQRADVLELFIVPLAAEQDRLALAYTDRVEIIDGRTGKRVASLPGDWIAVALSPNGKQVAVIGSQNQLQVLDIERGKVITTVSVGDAYGVAWRQDGAALFYGYEWPTHAIDPKTGKLLYQLDDPVMAVFEPDELDPSWRWIHRPDGSVIRTLDFQRLELGPNWARVGSGMFDGELAYLPDNVRFRLGNDPDAPAIHTVAELEPWLRSPGLIQTFFAGEPLPSPRLPNSQFSKLEKRKD